MGNCLFVDNLIVCSDPTRSRFTRTEPASGITINNLNEVTLGIGVSETCSDEDEDREYCQWKIAWSQEAHDANIKEVWYKDDYCFWNSATDDGQILQDNQGRHMCYSDILQTGRCKIATEDLERAKTPTQIQAICSGGSENKDLHSSSLSGDNGPAELDAIYNGPGTSQGVEITETSEIEKDPSFNENQNYDLGLDTRSIDKHRSEKRQGSSSIKLRARPFLS